MKPMHEIARGVPNQDLKLLGDTPYVFHCHHFNLFHDQTVEDALGPEEAFQVRSRAAQRVARQLLEDLVRENAAETSVERLQLAASLFGWMGHGKLELLADGHGGRVRGNHLHYSFAWQDKYGARVRRHVPMDAFAAGFSAAATEVAFDLPEGALEPAEKECYACRQPACEIELMSGGAPRPSGRIGLDVVLQHVRTGGSGIEEAKIAQITEGLNDFLQGVAGDERGLVQGFGIFITRHLSGYYNQTAYESIHHIEKTAPHAVETVEQLFGESGHVCVFNTIGNLLLSPEWEGLVGPLGGEVEEVVMSSTAISRGLGFGHWTIEELQPDSRLVLRSTSNYEFPFYLQSYGQSEKPRCYFFANAARAFMQLAHGVDWSSRPQLTDDLYQDLFKKKLQWTSEETQCCSKGDPYCEVVVTRKH